MMSAWLFVVIMRSLSAGGYVLAQAGSAAGACYFGGFAAAAAWAKVFPFLLPLFLTSAQSFAWMCELLEGAGVLYLGGCCGGSCCSGTYWASVCLLMCPVPSKFAAPSRSEAGGGGAYPCWYGCGYGLDGHGTVAGVFWVRPTSSCSLATPSLILLVSSARKLTVLVVDTCFSDRPMIYVSRKWIAAKIAIMMSRLVGS